MRTCDLAKLEALIDKFTSDDCCSDYDMLISGELSKHMAKAAEAVFDAYITAQLYWQKENV